MKTLVPFLILAAPFSMAAQSKIDFTITGHLKNLPLHSVYLVYMKDGKRTIDSALVSKNTYHFSGSVAEPAPASLVDGPLSGALTKKNIAEVFLTAAAVDLTHVDSFSNFSIRGSAAALEYQQLKAKEAGFQAQVELLVPRFQAAQKAGDRAAIKAIQKQADSINAIMAETTYGSFLRKNPGSPVALFSLQYYAQFVKDPTLLESLFTALPSATRSSETGKNFAKKLEIDAATAVGKPALDFTQNDTLGNPIALASFHGKYVLLDFWASWCGPCRMSNPGLVKVFEDYRDKSFTILGVSLDQEGQKDKWLAAIRHDNLNWTQVSDLKGWSNAVARQYGINEIPQNILLDPSGTIIAKNLDEEALRERLHSIFTK